MNPHALEGRGRNCRSAHPVPKIALPDGVEVASPARRNVHSQWQCAVYCDATGSACVTRAISVRGDVREAPDLSEPAPVPLRP